MKANEAPEKIYVERFDVDEEEAKFDKSLLFFDDIWVEEPEEPSQNYVEYTRTDAFIEKALAYLQDKFYFNNVFYGIVSTDFNAMEEMYEDFIKYMKGE